LLVIITDIIFGDNDKNEHEHEIILEGKRIDHHGKPTGITGVSGMGGVVSTKQPVSFQFSKFEFSLYSSSGDQSKDLNSKLITINQQLKDKLGIYEVKYKEVIDEFTKLQNICKDLENFYLETFNTIFKK